MCVLFAFSVEPSNYGKFSDDFACWYDKHAEFVNGLWICMHCWQYSGSVGAMFPTIVSTIVATIQLTDSWWLFRWCRCEQIQKLIAFINSHQSHNNTMEKHWYSSSISTQARWCALRILCTKWNTFACWKADLYTEELRVDDRVALRWSVFGRRRQLFDPIVRTCLWVLRLPLGVWTDYIPSVNNQLLGNVYKTVDNIYTATDRRISIGERLWLAVGITFY